MMTDAWPTVPLHELLQQNTKSVPVESDKSYKLLGVRLAGQGPFLREEKTGNRIQATRLNPVQPNDFIYSRLFAWRGALGLVPDQFHDCYVSSEFPTFRIDNQRVFPKYLNLYFSRSSIWDEIEKYCTGTTKASRNRFKEQFFLAMQMPLPPLDEQRRLVARIEALAAKIEEARGLRRLAVEEAEALYSAGSRAVFNGNKWDFTTIEKVVGKENLKNGKSLKSTSTPPSVNCLRISAMRDGRIDCSDTKPVHMTDEEADPYLVHSGDVFLVRGNGSKDLVGRAGVVKEAPKKIIFPDLFIKVPLDENAILARFFVAWWNSPQMRDAIQTASKTTSGIWKINQGHVASFTLPLPPLEEQRRIVVYLDGLQGKVDALKQLQAQTQVELDALLPSVLDKAFKGEL
jgi:type I restriction enzyme, S subunit